MLQLSIDGTEFSSVVKGTYFELNTGNNINHDRDF